MSTAAIFLADGFEEVEAIAAVDLLRREEIETVMVSVSDAYEVKSARGIRVIADKLIAALDFASLDMLILPGGLGGVAGLEACAELKRQLLSFHENQKTIAAICAAPAILGRLGILDGVQACVYPGMESELKGAEISTKAVVRDGHIITSRGMGTSIDFGLALVECFKGSGAAKALAEKIVYN